MSSYGNQSYNTRRTSNRYNTSGQFVPATAEPPPPPPPSAPAPAPAPAASFGNMRLTTQINNLHTVQTTDIEMKPELKNNEDKGRNTERPAWMKPKLAGVKKISNKERRRRQNASLRRLITPKNGLMVLNEMLPGEQLSSQYNVEPAGPFAPHVYGRPANFVAELKVHSKAYQGYGETKMSARNHAAEQAIRDLVLKRMAADSAKEAAATGGDADGEDGEDNQLPMLQLASFALHKLFSEWEYDGHRVPQLKPPKVSESFTNDDVATAAALAGRRPAASPGAPKPAKALPTNAAEMHPAMLLTYMRPSLTYRDLAQEGDRPQTTVFTVGVDIDGITYAGKGANKKEARRNAARAACEALFKVTFEENANETTPKPAA